MEEVVIPAHTLHLEHLGPDHGQHPLRLSHRRFISPHHIGLLSRFRQRPAIHLPVRIQRQLLQPHIRPRHHVLRQPPRHILPQLFRSHFPSSSSFSFPSSFSFSFSFFLLFFPVFLPHLRVIRHQPLVSSLFLP